MSRLKPKSQVRLRRAVTTITTLIFTMSLGNLSQAKPTVAQTPVSQLSAPASTVPAATTSLEPRVCPSDLEATIATIINDSRFDTAQWGIVVEPLSEPTVLYQHNANASFIPASNIKLLTTAAALQIVGDRTPQQHPSFENWVTEINRDSDNDLADALLRRIGGQAAVRSALALLGVNPDSYEQVDGSGLSRRNRATPSTFVTLLREMDTHDEGELFHRSLAIAGVNGTLRNRFRNTLVAGRLYGKTGTLRGVRALSGYLENPNYGTIAFSIVINQPGQSGSVMTQAIDQIVLETAQVSRCD